MGEGALLSWKALQQDSGVREIQTIWKRGADLVSKLSELLMNTLLTAASLSGETAKLVIENFLRSLANGNKYVFQTLPKILTLWLEHASSVNEPLDPKRGDNV